MRSRCTATTDTVCAPCQDEYFSSEHNHNFCKSCTICSTRKGSMEVKKCEKTSDRICMCLPGYMPDARYTLGSVCSPCPEGSYSIGQNENCQPWTNCSLLGKNTLRQGTKTDDAVCSNHVTQPATSRNATPALYLSTTDNENNVSTAMLSPSRPSVIPFICPDTNSPTETNWGSLSLILICLILLMVSGMSILLLIIQAAKKETKKKPCRNNQQGAERAGKPTGSGSSVEPGSVDVHHVQDRARKGLTDEMSATLHQRRVRLIPLLQTPRKTRRARESVGLNQKESPVPSTSSLWMRAQDMTEQTSEVGHLKIRACLLLVVCLWQWTQQTLATPCQDGELRIISKDKTKCCPKCSSDKGDDGICQNTQDHECKCRQGYSCTDSACHYCKKLPECAEGEELVKLGVLDFTFKCKPCEIGTYSNVKNGRCHNWTDCESSGFLTIKQGNSTHNAMCGFPTKDLEKAPVTNDSLYITILAILTAVAVFVLILLTFFLHFCIWSLKKEKYPTADNLERNFPRLMGAPQLSHHREETYSCQFPEEEHGDKTPEEKSCYFHPQSLP